MDFGGLSFHDARSLAAALGARVAQGRRRRVGRDDDEPALAVLDRLALVRSDWWVAAALALAELATASPDGAGAVADFFATAQVAPLWADTLDDLLAAGWSAEVAVQGAHHGGHGPTPAEALLPALRERQAALSTPGSVVFDRGRTRVYDLATEAGQDAASDDAVKTGRRRTHGRSAPCALGFWHPAAQAAPALRGALARQLSRQWSGADPRGWFCALEYLAVAPDLGWLAGPIAAIQASLAGDDARAALRFRADEPPKWPRKGWEALPIALPPSPTLAEVAQLAAERLAAEQATAPASEPLH